MDIPRQVIVWFKKPASIFWFFLCLYSLTWGGHYTSGDGAEKVAWGKAILFHGSANIGTETRPAYSKYGIGQSLLAIVPIAVGHLARQLTDLHLEAPLYTFIFIANGAWFLYLVGRYLQSLYPPQKFWLLVLILGLGTIWWPYTKLDFSEPLVLTLIFWGFVLLREGRAVLGILVGSLSITIRTDAILIFALLYAWQAWRSRDFKRIFRLAAGVSPAIVLIFTANYVRFHSIFEKGYTGESFSNPFLIGLYGILFSAGKSVFLFCPPLILGMLGWQRFRRTPHGRHDAVFFLSVFLVQLVVYAKWWDWSGDDSWGVRFMIPGVMLLMIPVIEVLDCKLLVLSAATLGILVQLPAVLMSGLDFVLLVHEQELTRKALYVGGQNRIDFEDVRYNPHYSQLLGQWMLIRQRCRLPDNTARPGEEEKTGTRLQYVGKNIQWTGSCRWDFIWCRIWDKRSGPETRSRN